MNILKSSRAPTNPSKGTKVPTGTWLAIPALVVRISEKRPTLPSEIQQLAVRSKIVSLYNMRRRMDADKGDKKWAVKNDWVIRVSKNARLAHCSCTTSLHITQPVYRTQNMCEPELRHSQLRRDGGKCKGEQGASCAIASPPTPYHGWQANQRVCNGLRSSEIS
jgi:hypothetical protein